VKTWFRAAGFAIVLACGPAGPLRGETVAVRYPEGVVRAFLTLRAPDGAVLADGDFIQSSRGDRVTSRTRFRFRDGSLQDEIAVFTQKERFRLVSDRLVQRGPSFPRAMDVAIDAAAGRVTVRSSEGAKDGKLIDERIEIPPDLANGMVPILLKNLAPETASTTVSMLVATPKPRMVKLAVSREGSSQLSNGRMSYRATRFRLKVELGGLAGAIAPLVGKQPKDARVWILADEAAGFMRSESQFYEGAPLWRIELAAPVYPKE